MHLLTKGSCISMVGSATIINVLRTFSHANDVLFVAHDHVNYFCFSLIKSCPTLATPWTAAHQALCPWDSPGKNTGVGCYFLLQEIFPTQGWIPEPTLQRLLLWQADSLP